jgi:hypothetical protein
MDDETRKRFEALEERLAVSEKNLARVMKIQLRVVETIKSFAGQAGSIGLAVKRIIEEEQGDKSEQ